MLEYKDKVIQLLRDKGQTPAIVSPEEVGILEDMFKRGTSEYDCARIIFEMRNEWFR